MSTLQVAEALAGDERAFRAVVGPYRRALEVHCYRMLGSIHDAEDVVQDTLLRAWRSFGRFQGRSSVETWLYRIATNACLDELEKRPRRAVEPYPDSRLEDADTSIADPAARYALHEGMELAFLTAIQRLPGRQRAVLILRDVLGWSAAESADLLDTTVTAVNSALQRARATIEAEAPAHRVAPGRGLQRELLRRYVDAWERADMNALLALLREDAVMTMPPQEALRGARGDRGVPGRQDRVRVDRVGDVGQRRARARPARADGRAASPADPRRRRRPRRRDLRVRPVLTLAVRALDHAGHLDARGDAELVEEVAQVRLDRLRAQIELGRDLGVRAPVDDQARDLQLALGQ